MATISKNGLLTTTLMIIPRDWAQFQALAHKDGTTASAMIRGFIRREIRRAEKVAAK